MQGILPSYRRIFAFVFAAILGLAGSTHSGLSEEKGHERLFFRGEPDTVGIHFVCNRELGFHYSVSILHDPGKAVEVGRIFLLGMFSADNRRRLINGLRTFHFANNHAFLDANQPQPIAATQSDSVLSLFAAPGGFEVAILGDFAEPTSASEYQEAQMAALKRFDTDPDSVRRSSFAIASDEQKQAYNAFLDHCIALGFKPRLSDHL